MRLARPLVAFDLETTGTSRHIDQIIEFGAVKRFSDGRPDQTKFLRFKPSCPISTYASRAHGIDATHLASAPLFSAHAAEIFEFLHGCDFLGHNLRSFDIPMLGSSLGRAAGQTWPVDFPWPQPETHVVDTLCLFRRFAPQIKRGKGNHTLSACYRYYFSRDLINAHSALADAQACMDIAEAMAAASRTSAHLGLGGNTDSAQALDAYGRTATGSQARSKKCAVTAA